MAGRKKKSTKPVAQVFNVVYEDGTLSSNRRIPGELLVDPFGTEDVMDLAQRAIEEQDAEIAQRSGVAKPPIKAITRARLDEVYASSCLRWSASRSDRARIVSVGFAYPMVGNTELPATETFSTSKSRQSTLTTPRSGVDAMRVVPE